MALGLALGRVGGHGMPATSSNDRRSDQSGGCSISGGGAIDAIISLSARTGLKERDLAGAVALDRFVWLNIGLDVGYVGIGLTLAICGWQLGRRMGLVGAGCGIMVQGLALTLLDLVLSRHILR